MSSTDSAGASAPSAEAADTSESDHDTPYEPVQPANPRSRSAAHAEYTSYRPSQNILNQGGTASDEAQTRLTQRSRYGKKCSVTFSGRHPECAHILPRSTRGWQLTTLEYVWGVKLGTLNLDTTQNMMWLSPDLHRWFDSGDWALLPPKSDLELIRDTSLNQLTWAKKTKFTAVCRRDFRNYDFVHFIETTQPIVRPDTPESVNYTMHLPPFQSLSPVSSHINPYFVICNVARKDEKHHPTLLGSGPGYATLTEEQLDRVRLCRTIYAIWMGQATAAAEAVKALPASKSQSNRTGAHSSTSRRSNPERQAKRKRIDDQDNPGPTDTGRNPKWRGGVTGSSLDDLSRTPEEFASEHRLDLFVNDFNSIEEPYWSKVQDWVTNLAYTDSPHDSGDEDG
ncbi:hypothetical protein RSOLAG22IIIB_12300 [Rhizoctonia solani]|uniref:HNH nuclease domain-containing protein n=1 Tax=Rhizoctonia solani TaxID=456999 RepID=A0A0K6GCY9_9AGAM|nr:hypothetical protein RSOLAG22IIIB_12300 [Rhizoctonia solani]